MIEMKRFSVRRRSVGCFFSGDRGHSDLEKLRRVRLDDGLTVLGSGSRGEAEKHLCGICDGQCQK